MIECRLLYSIDDMKRFYEAFDTSLCDLKSIHMDGQKVFIVVFRTEDSLNLFDGIIEKSKPTMLGCVRIEDVHMTNENKNSLREYIQELESQNEMLPNQREKYKNSIRKTRRNTGA